MNEIQFPERDRFFVIKTNNIIEEFISLEIALMQSNKRLLIIDKFERFHIPIGGQPWRVSSFEFLSDANKILKLECNSWTIETIDITYKSSSSLLFTLTFSDPLKRIRKFPCEIKRLKETPDSHDLEIVNVSITKLNILSKYQNWEQKDIIDENEKLKIINSELMKRLEKFSI
ncbi:hypothetical protein BH11BAC3_BH11BAC3_08170 [soil metagenome]